MCLLTPREPRPHTNHHQLQHQDKAVLGVCVWCAGVFHALASLRVQPPVQWMSQAVSVLAAQSGRLGVQELTTCLWALAALRYRSVGLLVVASSGCARFQVGLLQAQVLLHLI
jgi:hypothetical protein